MEVIKTVERLCDHTIISDVSTRIRDVYIKETCGIALDVVGDKIASLRKTIARKFIEPSENYVFHMTFAYVFRHVEREDIEEYSDQLTELKRYIYNDVFGGRRGLKFLPPKVYRYEDMTDFKRALGSDS